MPNDADRQALAAQQAQLVAALTAGAAPPAAFDPAQLHVAARALHRKRARAVAKTWPALARSLGHRFHDRFTGYATGHPLPATGPAADGCAFAEYLLRENDLPDHARVELLLYRTSSGWPLGCLRLAQSRRLVIALRLPLLGLMWLFVPLPGRTAMALDAETIP
jgi:hypothetical protein